MRWIDIIRIAARMVRANKLRGFLTVLGIGVAISLIIVLMGFGYGLQEITVGSIVRSKNALSLDITLASESGKSFDSTVLPELRSAEGISELTPLVVTSGEAHNGTKVGAATVIASQENYVDMEGLAFIIGRGFKDDTDEIVVSNQVLDLIDLTRETAVGKTVKLNYADPVNANKNKSLENLTIVGVSEDGDVPTVFIPYSLIGKDQVVPLTSVKAVAKDRDSVLSAQKTFIEQGYQVETLLDILDQARKVFTWITLGLLVFGLIAIVVAAIGMFNTLTISLLERTKDFGVMKAIGITDTTIRRLFLTEAGILGFAGGLTGVLLALLMEQVLGGLVNQILIKYGGTSLDLFYFPPALLLSMLVFPIILGLATGLYPAIRAAKLNPLKALRYE